MPQRMASSTSPEKTKGCLADTGPQTEYTSLGPECPSLAPKCRGTSSGAIICREQLLPFTPRCSVRQGRGRGGKKGDSYTDSISKSSSS